MGFNSSSKRLKACNDISRSRTLVPRPNRWAFKRVRSIDKIILPFKPFLHLDPTGHCIVGVAGTELSQIPGDTGWYASAGDLVYALVHEIGRPVAITFGPASAAYSHFTTRRNSQHRNQYDTCAWTPNSLSTKLCCGLCAYPRPAANCYRKPVGASASSSDWLTLARFRGHP